MKEILFVRFSDTKFGGAQRYLKRLDKELKSKGYKTDIIFSKIPKILPSWIRVLLFNRYINKISANKKNTLIFSLERVSKLDIYRAGDGVHRAYLKSKGFTLNPLHLTYLWLEKQTFNNAKLIIANSNMVKKEIINYYGIDKNKIEVIYNGIPLPNKIDEKSSKDRLKKEFNIDTNLPIILFVGSGFKRKGVDRFLKILSKIDTPFNAFVVGKDKHLNRYRLKAEKLGLNNVIFTGAREDVEIFYDASDIFLFPTQYEPFSNVVLEALSRECIAFTTKNNGASEILDSNFIILDDNDTSSKIENLINNKNMLKRYKKISKEIAQEFSIQKNATKTLKAIEKFLD